MKKHWYCIQSRSAGLILTNKRIEEMIGDLHQNHIYLCIEKIKCDLPLLRNLLFRNMLLCLWSSIFRVYTDLKCSFSTHWICSVYMFQFDILYVPGQLWQRQFRTTSGLWTGVTECSCRTSKWHQLWTEFIFLVFSGIYIYISGFGHLMFSLH